MWPQWALLGVLILLILAVAVAYKIEATRIPKKRARFVHRYSRSLSEIYSDFFAKDGIEKDRFESLWNEVSQILKLDPTRLLPSDRFDRELAPVEGFLTEDELADLEAFYDREAKRLGTTATQSKPETLGDLIRVLTAVQHRSVLDNGNQG